MLFANVNTTSIDIIYFRDVFEWEYILQWSRKMDKIGEGAIRLYSHLIVFNYAGWYCTSSSCTITENDLL